MLTTIPARADGLPRVTSRQVPSGNIRDYLSREARRITDGALADIPSAAAWRRLLPEKRRQFFEMMGIDQWWTEHREPPSVTVTGVVERERYRIEKLYYESLPRLFISGNLYVPKNLTSRAPGVLYVCGHAENQRLYFQAHARRFAELGFVCLIAETLEAAELEGFHHGCYREGWWHWYSRGYTAAGMELLNGIRALDLLAHRAEVDPAKLGITGMSGGGAVSWWIAAGDERVKVAAPVCGTSTLFSYIHDRTIDDNCDCIWWNNSYRWDLADVGALIAPRPLLIGAADKDVYFTIEATRQVHQQLDRLYRKLGAAKNLRLVETPGSHSYHERSRTEIFSWFTKHLVGREVPPSQVGDIDDRPEKQESVETLRVFVNGSPPGQRVTTIQDDFFTPPKPPEILDAASHSRERERVIAALKQKTFGAFPAKPPPLDLQIEYEFEADAAGHRFAFTSQESWRLHGQLLYRKPLATPAPAVVALRSPGEGRLDTHSFLLRMNVPWARVAFEPRGVGDTAWGEALNWHVRRASAWTGRTIASMRVWDTLRALQAARQLPEVDARHLALAARGEMCAIALYAALLDGRVRTVFLENPPATQNAASEKDGRGPALEMLNCLRVTDLAPVAGLLWPTELVFAGVTPPAYDWAEALYRQLGAPGRVSRVGDVGDWTPE
ncbi:MAG: prolyl oligopeptidase family serine peptidase [Verrucomicrobiales bacterium]|nr:prolyl oligopeptidase family serine peptidase [Verrucomicrobiales bacterium]